MTTIQRLAEFVAGAEIGAQPPALADCVRLHLFDTLVAGLAGGGTSEARAITATVGRTMTAGDVPVLGSGITTSLPLAALASCVAVRCTEIDDIHIASCTTPGSVVVPTALAVAWRKPLIEPEWFLSALLVGYEVMARFGRAADGPFILYRGIWPTYLSSTLGAAATTVRMLGLSAEQTAHALAAAVTLTAGAAGRIHGLSSRWLTLGCGVQNGILAALAAAEGHRGDPRLLDGGRVQVGGADVDAGKLLSGLGSAFEMERVSFKPYCAAKQATGAIYAFLRLLDRGGFDPSAIERVTVFVPSYYAAMIDHPELPGDRVDSIVGVQYQLALAAHHPEALADIHRMPIHDDADTRAFMGKVAVQVDEALQAHYPEAWPARVEVQAGGRREALEVLHVKGDPSDPFGWDDVTGKATRVLGGGAARQIEGLAVACRDLGKTRTVDDVYAALDWPVQRSLAPSC